MNKCTDDPERLLTPKFAQTVIRQITAKTGTPVCNDDLTQEALLRAVSAVRRIGAKIEHPCAFFRKIIRNVVHDYFRNWRIEVEFVEDRNMTSCPNMAEAIDRKRNAKRLGTALASLSICDLAVLQLFYTQELPIQTIAEIVGRSPFAVKMALHRGRKRLRTLLSRGSFIPLS